MCFHLNLFDNVMIQVCKKKQFLLCIVYFLQPIRKKHCPKFWLYQTNNLITLILKGYIMPGTLTTELFQSQQFKRYMCMQLLPQMCGHSVVIF